MKQNYDDRNLMAELEWQRLDAVAVVVLNPEKNMVLIKTKKNKKQDGVREQAIISGSGPLTDRPTDPDWAAWREVQHSIGLDLKPERMFLDKGNNVGVYMVVVPDENSALMEDAGTSVDRRWIPIEIAVRMNLAFGQQKYIQKVAEMIDKNAR